MKRHTKRKLWHDRRCRRMQVKKKSKSHKESRLTVNSHKESKNVYIAEVPQKFSFVNNTEDTIKYFVDIIEQIKKRNYKQLFFLDSKKVDFVTTDALVYVLAVLYNIKNSILMKYSFKGNLPEDEYAKKVYLESGFMNYVKTKLSMMPKTNDKIQILCGTKTDPIVAGQICDFVNKRFNTDYKFTLDLYKTLIELMSNTVHHAYDENSITRPCWYIYAIDIGSSIQFAFIDTGLGIPSTVKRRLLENIVPFTTTDSKLIYSAFLGESRTETGLYNRGHGLPALYKKVLNGQLRNFFVLSGKGCCKSVEINNKIELEKLDYENEVFGTIFQFEIVKIKEVIAC